MNDIDTPVLIVGGGPVGLTASILLGQLGVPSVLIERRADVTDHPRSRVISTRSVEIYRSCGIAERLEQVSLPSAWRERIVHATTLAGPEVGRIETGAWRGDPRLSPVTALLSSQDRMEPILRERAESASVAELRFSAELTGLSQDGDGVAATILDRSSGTEQRLQAEYLIGADGAGSFVRETLGIELEGQEIASLMNVYFRADLGPWVSHRQAILYFVNTPEISGVLAPLDGGERWVAQIRYDRERESAEDFTDDRCAGWIRTAVGDDSVALDILSVNPWTMRSVIAERSREGRVFLVGDAAHQLPPTGGFGMNTGVQSVHNLAWKLAGVIQGWAAPALLDTYELERVPVARYNSERSLAHFTMVVRINATVAARALGGEGDADTEAALRDARPYGNFIGMDLGFAYEQGALVPDGSAAPVVDDPIGEYTPTARPGHRAPHVMLELDGARRSTLDLFDTRFTLLAGAEGGDWAEAARAAATARGVPLVAQRVGADGDLTDPGDLWLEAFGLTSQGAVLVRPDGHVAWRGRASSEDPHRELERAFAAVLGS